LTNQLVSAAAAVVVVVLVFYNHNKAFVVFAYLLL
jgi:hypothetical protein